MFPPSHLHHISTTGICHLFCNTLNLGSTAFYGLWTTVPGILSATMCLNTRSIGPCVHLGGKPLGSPHQPCKYTSSNNPAVFWTASSRASTSRNSFLTLPTNNLHFKRGIRRCAASKKTKLQST